MKFSLILTLAGTVLESCAIDSFGDTVIENKKPKYSEVISNYKVRKTL